MDSIRTSDVFPRANDPVRRISGDESKLPPWLFRHQDLENALESAKTVDRKTLTNTFNHIHFMDEYLFVHLRHPKYNESILLKAYPEPCLGEELTCRLTGEELTGLKLDSYEFLHLVIDDGQCLMLVPAELKWLEKVRFRIQLPEQGYAVGQRQAKRYCCKEIDADLIQSGFLARGELLDFSPAGLRVKVRPEPHCSFQWLNSEEPVTIHLRKDRQILFSGSCRCVRQHDLPGDREIVLAPVDRSIKRFKNKEARNIRQQLLPSPALAFNHPLLNKRTQLDVHDISTSGFSVFEVANERVLLPGMIIPDLKVIFSGALEIGCTAQVIYRKEEEKESRCGLAILDMDINAYSRLTQILTNVMEPNTHISSEVDMEALWEFFFDTGFIYPKKYRIIQSRRGDFKKVYRKLYQENPEIAKHFT
ncbi:MAG: PilZ domain-containing protein [Deltaproteobacteria bacterium]|nr:PilZ domain-containing protein [Deltaproteobacteria bacterium]